jgi:hypothetical protein
VTVSASIAIAAVVVVPSIARATRADFLGAEVCGKCHERAYAAWSKTAHARASESLGRKVTSRRCLACHSTGEAPAGRPFYSGVQCEACHGAGGGYAAADIMRNPTLARELGLRELNTAEKLADKCITCHRASTRLAPFDVAAAWKRIRHP